MAQVTISFEADLRKAVEAFVATARRVKELDGGLQALTKSAKKAGDEIEKSADGHGKAAKHGQAHSHAVNELIGKFTAWVGVMGLAEKGLEFINSAVEANIERAKEYAAQMKELVQVNKELFAGSGDNLGRVTANRQLAGELGARHKVGREQSLEAVAKLGKLGYGKEDIGAALDLYRTRGVAPGALAEIAKTAIAGGERVPISTLANQILGLDESPDGDPQQVVETLQKTLGPLMQLGLTEGQAIGGVADVGRSLKGKKAASGIERVIQALSGTHTAARSTLTAEQLAGLQQGHKLAGGAKKGTFTLSGTLEERIATLQQLDPEAYRALSEDAEGGIVLGAIGRGAFHERDFGNLLGPAVRARNADASIFGEFDNAAAMESATMAGEGREGAKWLRGQNKLRLLREGLRQKYGGQTNLTTMIGEKLAGDSIPKWMERFGGSEAFEGEIEQQAARLGVSLDPNRVAQGRAAATIALPGGQATTPERAAEIHDEAVRRANAELWRRFPNQGPGYDSSNRGLRDDLAGQYEQEGLEIERQRLEIDQKKRDEVQEKMLEHTEHQSRAMLRGPWNGSLRDWRAEDTKFKTPSWYPDRSARAYFG